MASPQVTLESAARSSGETPLRTGDVHVPLQERDVAALSYLLVMSVIVYGLRRRSAFIRFHSKQAMLLFAASIAFWPIPYIGKALELFVLLGIVRGFVSAARGEWNDVPVAGPFSRGKLKEGLLDLGNLPMLLWRGLQRIRSGPLAKQGKASILPDDPLPPSRP